MKVLLDAIYNKALTGTNTFKTAVGSRFYFKMAPQNPTFPFSVFDIMLDSYQPSFYEDHDVITVQIDICSQSTTASEVLDIYEYEKSLFDWCSLTITGYALVEMRRQFSSLDYYEDDSIWVHTTEYEVWIRKT